MIEYTLTNRTFKFVYHSGAHFARMFCSANLVIRAAAALTGITVNSCSFPAQALWLPARGENHDARRLGKESQRNKIGLWGYAQAIQNRSLGPSWYVGQIG